MISWTGGKIACDGAQVCNSGIQNRGEQQFVLKAAVQEAPAQAGIDLATWPTSPPPFTAGGESATTGKQIDESQRF